MSDSAGASAPGKTAAPTKGGGALKRWLLRLVAPVLLVVVVGRLGDPGALLEAIGQAALWPLVAAVSLNVVVNHLKVIRWRAFLKKRGYLYSVAKAWKAVLPSLYLGAITPGRVGDMLRIKYIAHDLDTPYAEGLAVSVMDRLCDLYVLSAYVAFGIAHFADVLHGDLALVTWAAVAVATLAPLGLLIPGLAETLMGGLYRKMSRSDSADGLTRFLAALRGLLGKVLLLAVPLTAAAFMVNYVQGWLIGQALGIELGFIDVLGMMAITSLLGLMPISISGLGVRELFLSILFPFLGFTAEQGVAFGLVLFSVIFLVNVVAGFIAWQIVPPPFDVATGSAKPVGGAGAG